MDKAELNHVIEGHKRELEALNTRLGSLREGQVQVSAREADGTVRDDTHVHITELERLELWLTENVARFEALLGA